MPGFFVTLKQMLSARKCLLVLMLIALSACERHIGETKTVLEPTHSARPNILLIVLDDFGFNDLGANGNALAPTPSLDKFAAQGIRYTRHYADATCTASRVALLTGVSPVNYGFRPAHLRLPDDASTIAGSLKKAGYVTQHIGKWHVGNSSDVTAPLEAGFDNWFGFLTQFELRGLSRDGIGFSRPTYHNPWLQGNRDPIKAHKGHLTDILTDRAIEFLQQREADQPWFLNLWYFAPHNPVQPSLRYLKQYPKTDEGRYYALIDQLDVNIARVLATLDENHQAENTLVIILSDNGGTNQLTNNNAPFFGVKGQFYEGGVRTPLLIRWPGRVAANKVSDDLVSIYDMFPTIAEAASAQYPKELVGKNLFNDSKKSDHNLYWEYSTSEYHSYSALSSDGRWRVVHKFAAPAELNDLKTDPTGEQNVIDKNKAEYNKLRQAYLEWHRSMREVSTQRSLVGDNQSLMMTGNDYLRSPGYSGFTFAIGVTPGGAKDQGWGLIAEQKSRWRLAHSYEKGLSLDMTGLSLNAPPLVPGVCHEVVVASHHMYSPLKPAANRVIINLYVDGEEVDSLLLKKPAIYLQGYANPTFIGQDSQGGALFSGVLGTPVILNERIVVDEQGEKVGNGLASLPTLCVK